MPMLILKYTFMKDKPTDNTKELAKQKKRTNRLNSIKNGIEGATITDFEQIFAIVSETKVSNEMGISYYAFKKKVADPGEFSIKEIMRFAALFGVKYDTMHSFIMEKIKARSKSRIFRE